MASPSFTIQNSPADLVKLGAPKAAAEFTPSELFTLRSLGWNLNRLHQTLSLLRARVKNKTLPPQLVDFLGPLLKSHEEKPLGEMNLRVAWQHNGLKVEYSTLPANSALSLALFWLPALNAFWERTLRRAAFQRMRRVLPRAWFLIPEDPPPGAVIPGLQLRSWSDLTAESGSFWLVQDGSATSLSAESLFETSIEKGSELPGIAIAKQANPDERSLLAHYEHKGARIELQSLMFL